MPHKEGSLEAPTRHPLDWQSEAFYDQAAIDAETSRAISTASPRSRPSTSRCSNATRATAMR
ncbi:hypothetical protein KPA97_50425 [Burkholderia cenocepacia]|nr:hypothetical protein [Burkholderia cenocepacia]MDR5668130.1 hypothetical protein [Burkholderia cenocepacia]